MPDFSVVIPVFKNKETVVEIHSRLNQVLSGRTYEIIFVDDGCPERSIETLNEIASRDSRVKVLSHKVNAGQAAAVLTGLKHSAGSYAIIMDADLQDPPEAIPKMIEQMKEPLAAVFAGKVGRYESSFRLMTSRFYKTLLHFSGGLPVDAGLYVLLTRRMIDYLLSFERPSRSILAMMACSKMQFASIPVERKMRESGKSSYNFRKRMKIALDGIRFLIRNRKR